MPPPPRKSSSNRRGARLTSRQLLAAGITFAIGLPACGGGPDQDRFGTTEQALTGADAIARAQLWVTAEVPYCQSPNGQPDPDPSCSAVCMRPTNAAWDPYRSDCSGFVSWAWNLPAPGRTTDELAPAVTDVTEVIDGNALQPGDALNVPGDHIILFVSWITPGQSANFMEEPGCSATPDYAHAFTSNVEISGSSVTVDYENNTFTAIRYTGITGDADAGTVSAPDGGTACFVTSLGLAGDCISTSACAALGGHTSTPGYCPGAADIQCCTATTTGCTANSQCSGMTPVCETSTGACRGCNSNTDCSQGVCAVSANDPLRGSCVQCTVDSECTAPDICDTVSDTCVTMAPGCTANSQCSGSLPICDTSTGTCRACDSNTDCSQGVCATGANDPLRGRCVQCAGDSGCTAPDFCDTVSDTCVQCLSDAQCGEAKPVCKSGVCEGCLVNSDCSGSAHGTVCQTSGTSAGQCVACTLTDTSACGGASRVCDESIGTCVECLTNADCKDATNPICSGSHLCVCSSADGNCKGNTADAGSSSGSGNQATSGGCATGTSDLALLGLLCGVAARRRRSFRERALDGRLATLERASGA